LLPNNSASHSSEAKGAAVVHRDEYKIQQNTSSTIKLAIGVAAAVTKNPVLELVNKILSGDNKGEALQRLGTLAQNAGITQIKGVKLDTAINQAQVHASTIRAVESLKDNGITGTLYPPAGQNLTSGTGPNSKVAFVMQCAVRANNSDADKYAVREMTKPPLIASQAQRELNNAAGITTLGNRVTQNQAEKFKTQVIKAERDGTVQLTQAVRDQGLIPRATAVKQSKELTKLLLVQPAAPVQNKLAAENPVMKEIDTIGQRHEEAMKAQDEINKAIEEKRKEEERLLAEKTAAHPRQAGNRTASAILSPMPMPRMGAAQLEQLTLN